MSHNALARVHGAPTADDLMLKKEKPIMTNRGRPSKHGTQPLWMVTRAMKAVYAYQHAREAGTKYSAAVREAVASVRNQFPMSEIELKRILAKWQPKNARVVFLVVKPDDCGELVRFPDGKLRRVLSIAVGPRPKYPRHNAKT
jgi:hypothetical protein